MFAATTRVAKPKLSLSISTHATQSTRPSLTLKSPVMPRTPISPSPTSPTARNTRINRKGYASFAQTQQQPSSYSYSYANSSCSKSILKKGKSGSTSSTSGKKLQISPEPIVYCVTPIEAGEEYYGGYVKMSRDERRWARRTYE